MKRIFILLTVCLVLLAGCDNNNPSANLPPQNGNPTQAVDVNGTEAQAPTSESSEAKDVQTAPVKVPAGAVVEIKERLFIAQINDIYYNAADYLGKSIKLEGIFDIYYWEEENQTYYYVMRYGPGCCGNDGNVGFEVTWDGDYPSQDDWVEAIGILEEYEEDGYAYLRLVLSSLTVLPTRGEEYVSQ